MPIYAYKCASCGYAKDALQKISDPPLTVCPRCGASALVKQVTAAGFQLKGSGWYVTDFRGDGKGQAKPEQAAGEAAAPQAKSEAKPGEPSASQGASAAPAASAPATAAPAPAKPAPAAPAGQGD